MLRTETAGLRLLSLEALPDASLPEGRIGRAFNGNAVLTGVEAEVVSVADPSRRESVHFTWAWADHEQPDGDHRVVNVLDTADDLGWAVDAHRKPGGRVALLLGDRSFGFEGGSEITVRLQYRSMYDQHVIGRVRLALGKIDAAGLALLPDAVSGWYVAGPFPVADRGAVFDQVFGPEEDTLLDRTRTFGVEHRPGASTRAGSTASSRISTTVRTRSTWDGASSRRARARSSSRSAATTVCGCS